MNVRDLLAMSTGNLWRMKLRAFLTVSGVVIAIAAFVSMLSFGAGMQQSVSREFEDLGLFSTMQVFPPKGDQTADSSEVAVLNGEAVEALSKIPGVNLAYPFDAFSVTACVADTQVATSAQALPGAAVRTRLFSKLLAGSTFAGDSSREALVTEELLEAAGIDEPDSIVGRSVVVSARVASVDSAIARVFGYGDGAVAEGLENVQFDLLTNREYREKVIREQLNNAVTRFLDGYLTARNVVRDTLRICGVLERQGGGPMRIKPLIIPVATARRFGSGGLGGNPADLFAQLGSGTLLATAAESGAKRYPQVTLDLDPRALHETVRDSVEAMGFRTFSYAEQFDEARRFFLYFDLALGVVGFIALVVASLGIVNTLVTSIVERRREIGVLKSLGADERYIRVLFLVESGVIGTLGASAGIVLGWLITRVASAIARTVMEREGLGEVELFAMPPWLVLTAFLFGLAVSLAAGSYPASRAAHLDPVEALRND